jgi:peptide/nickel transport system substrate-binding protein
MAQTVESQVEYGDRVKIGCLLYFPVNLNPLFEQTEYEGEIQNLIFGEGLFTRNNQGEVVNGLAEISERESDNVWRFKLKPNIYFHNRSQMTSEDVKFTFELYKKFAAQSSKLFDVRYVSTVEIFDDLNLRIILNRPIEKFRETIGQLPVLQKEHYRQWLDYNFIASLPDITPTIGCGYFIHRPLDTNSEIRLDVNLYHYNGRANLAGIDFVFYESYEQLVEAFLQERVDVIQIQDSSTRQKLFQIARSFRFLPAWRDDLKLYYINLNVTRSPFNDSNIRKAINYAIDKKSIVNKYLENKGNVASNVLNARSDYYLDFSGQDIYDPVRSIDILNRVGYRRQATGKLFKNNIELKFEFYFEEGSSFQESIVRLIAINLGELGINVVPIPLKPTEIKLRLSEGRYQAALQHFVYDPISSAAVLREFYQQELNKGDRFRNFDERFINQRIEISERTLPESDVRQISVQIQDRIINNQPCIFLFIEERVFYAFHMRISRAKNIVINNNRPILKIYPFHEWYVRSNERKY